MRQADPSVAAADSPAAARRNANLYLVGMTASFLGGSALVLAAGIWVKSLTGSSSLAALVSVCIYAPSLLAPVAGLLADRVRRKPLLVVVNAATAGVLLLLLAVRSEDQTALIYAVMLCYGAALALIDPAEQGLFVVMLSTDERRRLNGLRMSLQEGGKLVAPLAGAGLFALYGGGAVAAVTSAAFAVAAASIWRLRVTEPAERPPRRGWLDELAGGFRHLLRQRELRVAAAAAAAAMFVSGFLVAAQFSLVDGLDRPPSFLGVITGLLGAGSIVASLASSRVIRATSELRLLMLGLANGTAGYLLVATELLPVVLVGSFVLGFALPWTVVAVINLSQRLTPVDLQGRVAAALGMLLFAPQPLAQLGGASLVATVPDYRVVYLGAALLTGATLAAVAVRSTRVRSGRAAR